ncbi:MAG: hypothetical protein IKS97_03005 [Fibrobacter sp.]|nr:hypothetical protein [Fibrobacter sp.]
MELFQIGPFFLIRPNKAISVPNAKNSPKNAKNSEKRGENARNFDQSGEPKPYLFYFETIPGRGGAFYTVCLKMKRRSCSFVYVRANLHIETKIKYIFLSQTPFSGENNEKILHSPSLGARLLLGWL